MPDLSKFFTLSELQHRGSVPADPKIQAVIAAAAAASGARRGFSIDRKRLGRGRGGGRDGNFGYREDGENSVRQWLNAYNAAPKYSPDKTFREGTFTWIPMELLAAGYAVDSSTVATLGYPANRIGLQKLEHLSREETANFAAEQRLRQTINAGMTLNFKATYLKRLHDRGFAGKDVDRLIKLARREGSTKTRSVVYFRLDQLVRVTLMLMFPPNPDYVGTMEARRSPFKISQRKLERARKHPDPFGTGEKFEKEELFLLTSTPRGPGTITKRTAHLRSQIAKLAGSNARRPKKSSEPTRRPPFVADLDWPLLNDVSKDTGVKYGTLYARMKNRTPPPGGWKIEMKPGRVRHQEKAIHRSQVHLLLGEPGKTIFKNGRIIGHEPPTIPVPANGNGHPQAVPPAQANVTAGLVLRGENERPLVDGVPKRPLTIAEYDAITFMLSLQESGISRPQSGDLGDADNPGRRRALNQLSRDPDFGRFVSTPEGKKGRGYAILSARKL